MKILEEIVSKLVGIMNGSTFTRWKASEGFQTLTVYTFSKDQRQTQVSAFKIPAFSAIRVKQ